MTTEEMISSVIKEINSRGGFQNQRDFELTMRRILSTKFDEARKAAIEEEREACAKIADAETEGASTYQWQHAAEQIAETIRARSS